MVMLRVMGHLIHLKEHLMIANLNVLVRTVWRLLVFEFCHEFAMSLP